MCCWRQYNVERLEPCQGDGTPAFMSGERCHTDKKLRAAVFGAGQAGRILSTWIPTDYELVCYIDNNEALQESSIEGIPVLSLERAMKRRPDIIYIGILNRQANRQIKKQISDAGFGGEIRDALFYRDSQDIRCSGIRLIAREIKRRGVPGNIAELGVYRGDTACELNRLFPERNMFLFDTFTGFDERDLQIERSVAASGRNASDHVCDFTDTGVELVREKLPYPQRAHLISGYFPESLSAETLENMGTLALVSLDPDLYKPVYEGLKIFYPMLAKGGAIVIHDYNSLQFPGVHKAVERYCREENLFVVPLMDLHGTAVLIKQG